MAVSKWIQIDRSVGVTGGYVQFAFVVIPFVVTSADVHIVL